MPGEGARLTVLVDLPRLTRELKIIACTCCERAEVDGVGGLAAVAAEDLELLRKHLPDETAIESPASSLEEALGVLGAGAGRVSASSLGMLEEWKRRVSAENATE